MLTDFIVSKKILKYVLLITFIAAFLNPILRISNQSDMTLFRIFLPFAFIMVSIVQHRYRYTYICSSLILLIFCYCAFQLAFFNLAHDLYVLSYTLNVVFVMMFIYLVYSYKVIFGVDRLYRFLFFWFLLMTSLSAHQIIFGANYPIVENRVGVARIFYGQENDVSLAIAAFLPVLAVYSHKYFLVVVLLVLAILIVYVNSARGVLVSVVFLAIYLFVVFLARLIGGGSGPRILTATIIFSSLICFVLIFKDSQLSIKGDADATIENLVVTPILDVLSGKERPGEITSINIRVNLAIYAMYEYFESYGFGIGPGEILPLALSYYPGVAGSIHVFPLEMLVEFGWLFVSLLFILTVIWGPRVGWKNFLLYFLYAVSITASMSSGVITNYYFFACCTFLFTGAQSYNYRKS